MNKLANSDKCLKTYIAIQRINHNWARKIVFIYDRTVRSKLDSRTTLKQNKMKREKEPQQSFHTHREAARFQSGKLKSFASASACFFLYRMLYWIIKVITYAYTSTIFQNKIDFSSTFKLLAYRANCMSVF